MVWEDEVTMKCLPLQLSFAVGCFHGLFSFLPCVSCTFRKEASSSMLASSHQSMQHQTGCVMDRQSHRQSQFHQPAQPRQQAAWQCGSQAVTGHHQSAMQIYPTWYCNIIAYVHNLIYGPYCNTGTRVREYVLEYYTCTWWPGDRYTYITCSTRVHSSIVACYSIPGTGIQDIGTQQYRGTVYCNIAILMKYIAIWP